MNNRRPVTQPGLFDAAEVWAGPDAQPAGHHIRVHMAAGTWKTRILHDLDDPILTMNTRLIYARGERRPPNREYVAALRAWVADH
jgi:hypothetical protein